MLASLGKAQDRLDFLQRTDSPEDDNEMVVVCHNVLPINSKIYVNVE